MKKISLLLLTIILCSSIVFSATYTINKNGTITTPTGQSQTSVQKIPSTTQNNSAMNTTKKVTNFDDDDMPFSMVQQATPQAKSKVTTQKSATTSKTTSEPSVQEINKIKADNETIIRQLIEPDIDFRSISLKYGKDPDAERNRLAIVNKKNPEGCIISTFSITTEYGITCEKWNWEYGYYYKSVSNPKLTRIAYIDKKNDYEIVYNYKKFLNTWSLDTLTIRKGDMDFTYRKDYDNYNRFTLSSYYIGDTCYNADGTFGHKRYVNTK